MCRPKSLINAALAVGVDERYLAPGVVDTQALADWVIEKRLHAAEAAAAKASTPKAEPSDEDDDALLAYAENELQVDKKLTTLMRRQSKQLKELKERDAAREKQFADMQANSAKRHVAAINHAIDDAVEKLGSKFEAVLGKGPIGTLKDQDAIDVRSTIYMAAKIDQNDSPSVAAKKYEAAARKMYKILDATPPPPAKNGKPLITEDEWAAKGLSRPTSSLPSQGKKAALDYIRDHMRQNGQVQAAVDDDFDGLPD
jgi:hypothetical protein